MAYRRIHTEDHRTVMDTVLYDNLQDGIDELKSETTLLQQEDTEIKENVAHIEGDILSIQENVSQLDKKDVELSQGLSNLETQLIETTNNIENSITKIQENITDLQGSLTDLGGQIVDLGVFVIQPEDWFENTYSIHSEHIKTTSDIYIRWIDVEVMSKCKVTYSVVEGILTITVESVPVNTVTIEKVRCETL